MKNCLKILIFIIAVVCALNLSSCNKETKYNTLSTFFDGVPKPGDDTLNLNRKKKDSVDKKKSDRTTHISATIYQHPPYADRSCESCHESRGSNRLSSPMPDLCYTCHEDFRGKFTLLHGPLETGDCTVCHSPHESEFEKLVKRKGQDLCLFCHLKQDIEKTDLHKEIGDQKCWECHNPHGGADRTFMK